MTAYFFRALAAHCLRQKSLVVLTVFGVALGVASVLSIQIINRNAVAAFEGSVRAVSGEADLSVLPSGPTLDERLYPAVLAERGVAAAWPIHRTHVAVAGKRELYLEIVGLDSFAALEVPWSIAPEQPASPLAVAGWSAITPELAGQLGLTVGDGLAVTSGSRRVHLVVGALADFRRVTPLATSRLVVMDIAQAQSAFGERGRIHQIDVRAAPGQPLHELQARLAAALGPLARVVTPAQRRDEASALLAAFRLNLTALSLVSVLVGGFLVYGSTTASLVRRRAELGLLRALGGTRAQILALLVAEVGLLAAAGILAGVPLGWAAAVSTVDEVSRTLSNVYLLQQIETLALPWQLYVVAAAVGLAGALGGALLPALEMSRTDPRALLGTHTLEERIGRAAWPLFLAGWVLIGATVLVTRVLVAEWKPGGFALGLALLVGLPLMAPWAIRAATHWLPAAGFGLLHGAKSLGLALHTSTVPAAALSVAVSMLIGTTLMIGSFRRTIDVWLQASARADVYITSDSWRRAREQATLAPELVEALSHHPGLLAVDRIRQLTVDAGGRRVNLGAADFSLPLLAGRLTMVSGDRAEAFRRVRDEGAALVGEPFARKTGLAAGDRLAIATANGTVELPIAGIYHDYTSDAGSAAIDLTTMERLFGPGEVNSVALYLAPGRDPDEMIDELHDRFAGWPLEIRSNRGLREQALAIFDQTFAVTRLLQVMSLLIAACGITLSLIVLARERIAELALYRALGAGRRQILRVFLGKGLGIALAGLGLGAIGGVALALVLIFAVNRQYFGWTIALYWPWSALAEQVATILAAALLASLYPALRASRTPATELTREMA